MRPTLAFALAFSAATLAAPLAHAAGASDTEQERNARWQEIAKSIFGDKQIAPTDTLVKLEAPKRAIKFAANDFVISGIGALRRRNIQRRGQVVDDSIQHCLNAFVLQ